MKLRLSFKNTAATALAAAMFVSAAASATPALAAPKAPTKLDRKSVIKRAKSWTSKRVPYSQTGYKRGYRRDCSGFIAMAWNLPVNVVTWNIPTVAKRIRKDQLRPGDVLLNDSGGVGGRHVVMFEKWANKSKTKYYLLEQTGASGVDSAVRRVMPYPYKFDKSLYKPYRFKSVKGYYSSIPRGDRQMVEGYKPIEGKKAKSAAKPKSKAVKRNARPKTAEPKVKAPARDDRPAPATRVPAEKPATGTKAAEPLVNSGFLGAFVGWLVGK